MKVLRFAIFASILVGLLFIPHRRTLACSCGFLNTEKNLQFSNAVFTGRVIAIAKNPNPSPVGLLDDTLVTLFVMTSWKGVDEPLMVVKTNLSEASCGYDFEIGRDYLIFAYGKEKPLSTGLCAGARFLENASQELEELDKGEKVQMSHGQNVLLPLSVNVSRNPYWNCRKNRACRRVTRYACQWIAATPGITVFCR
jgi:hypothetical protein